MEVVFSSKKNQKLLKKYGNISTPSSPNVTTEVVSAASIYIERAATVEKEKGSGRKTQKRRRKNTNESKVEVASSVEISCENDSFDHSLQVFQQVSTTQMSVNHTELLDTSFDELVSRPGDHSNYFDNSLVEMQPEESVSIEPRQGPSIINKKQKKGFPKRNGKSQNNDWKYPRNPPAFPKTALTVLGDRFVADFIWQSCQKGALVYFPKYTSFALKGRLRLTVLKGAVEIFGAVLNASSKSYEVYSPKGYSLIVVNCLDSVADFHYVSFLGSKQIEILKAPDTNEVLLFLERIDNSLTKFLDEHLDSKMLREEKTDSNLSKEELMSHRELHQLLQCNILTKQVYLPARYYEENPQWRNLVSSLSDYLQNSQCRVALCGGKGVGKSTLLRYVVNSLLKDQSKVIIIDLDPGQSEFTMPTCISIISVTEPLFGPNFSHLKKPKKCLYLGTVDVASSVTAYTIAVSKLITWFSRQKEYENKACIVNTMGFNSGIGVDLLVDTLRISGATHVVELASKSMKRNYPFPLDPYTVSTVNRGRITKPSPGDFMLSYLHFRIDSVSESAAQPVNEWGHKPAQLREYVVLAYLSQLCLQNVRPSQAVASAKTIQIPFCSVAVACIHEDLKPQYILSSLNGALVSLCDAELNKMNLQYPADQTMFRVAKKPVPVQCLGFGVVTRIDVDARCFYIATPESVRASDVTLLCLGKMSLPDAIYFGGSSRRPFDVQRQTGGSRITVPYVAESLIFEGISQPFRKHNPFRGNVHMP